MVLAYLFLFEWVFLQTEIYIFVKNLANWFTYFLYSLLTHGIIPLKFKSVEQSYGEHSQFIEKFRW